MCSTRAVDGLIHMITFETDYDKWLCVVVLLELDAGLSGVFVRGGRTEDRERAPRSMTQPALAGLGVTLARLAGLFGMLITSRGPGTLHVLSTPYELLGDKRVPSAELMVKL